jgi:hypothetical protein
VAEYERRGGPVAAVAYPFVDTWVATRPPHPARPVAPARPKARVYRRRRAVALFAVAVVALMVVTVSRMALAGSGGGALTTSGSSGATAPLGARRVYVVQPGDTLWSIVVATGHGGDPRPEVDRLAMQLDGRALQPGQRIQLS